MDISVLAPVTGRAEEMRVCVGVDTARGKQKEISQ